jgi:hypothetical protein
MIAEATRAQAQAQAAVLAQRGIVPEAEEAAQTPVARLSAIVERYVALRGDDDRRLVNRRQLADEMLTFIVCLGITARNLVRRIMAQANDHDGRILALASLVAVSLAPGDGSRLLEPAPVTTQDFVQYQILLAIYGLKVRCRLTDAETVQARPFVRDCLESNNTMLTRKAQSVLEFLDNA